MPLQVGSFNFYMHSIIFVERILVMSIRTSVKTLIKTLVPLLQKSLSIGTGGVEWKSLGWLRIMMINDQNNLVAVAVMLARAMWIIITISSLTIYFRCQIRDSALKRRCICIIILVAWEVTANIWYVTTILITQLQNFKSWIERGVSS